MGFFDNFKKNSAKVEMHTEVTPSLNQDAFTTYRTKIDILDQIPYIDTEVGLANYVHFYHGDNLMPQKYDQLYNSGAPIHASCINTTVDAVIGGGIAFSNYDTLSLTQQSQISLFMRRNRFEQLAKQIAFSYKNSNRINIKVCVYDGGLIKFEALNPSEIRYNRNKSMFWHTENWITHFELCKWPKYEGQTEPGTYMLEFDGEITSGTKPYPLPKWNTCFLDVVNGGEIPLFHRANMENSVNPGIIVSTPFIITDPLEKKAYVGQFKGNSGSQNTGRTTHLFANGKENLPEITQIQANPNDKQFEVLGKNTVEQICYAHQMNPAILGVKTPGSLGMNQELAIGYQIFENTVVFPMRRHLEWVLNELAILGGIDPKVSRVAINDFALFDKELLAAGTSKPEEQNKNNEQSQL